MSGREVCLESGCCYLCFHRPRCLSGNELLGALVGVGRCFKKENSQLIIVNRSCLAGDAIDVRVPWLTCLGS